uniref:Thiazole synthase n=1 Tax=Bangiopsis subsimplex TaxID=139980 RepID=A0A1C9CCW9_9RHOD|nr:thiamin biosynthesis protein G [Bangiopsis subsimplex]AOM66236.1 thiamin biosynthesis protein G [Bangiopsis subsimplex]ARO90402.1 thiazole biosynthesis protein ThiG [Bangiopsis subsimplex]
MNITRQIRSMNIAMDILEIGEKSFSSRVMLGTGKYRNLKEASNAIKLSKCEVVTFAVRRAQTSQKNNNILNILNDSKIWLLPNTAGCQTCDEAIRVAFLGREIVKEIGQVDNNFIKLEVIPDPKYLLPDPIATLKAAEYLCKEGFIVLPYMNADPILAKHLEAVGCAAVMPLGSPIGTNQGLKTLSNIAIIIENAKVPVIVDAGIGTSSDAAKAMELGASGILVNTCVARASSSATMATAINLAVQSGRLAYLSGLANIRDTAQASSPETGISKTK